MVILTKKIFAQHIVYSSLTAFIVSSCLKVTPIATQPLPSATLEKDIVDSQGSIQLSETLPIDWWKIFEDPQLTSLVEKAITNNPSIKVAKEKILYASYNVDSVQATLYPFLYLNGDVTRQKLSETAIIPFQDFTNSSSTDDSSTTSSTGIPSTTPATGGTFGIPVYFTQYEIALKLNYEFDFWEKKRNTLRAAISQVQAQVADAAFVRLQIAMAVAQAYFQLQIDYQRLEILQRAYENKKSYFETVQERVKYHVDTDLALHQAQANAAIALQAKLQVEGDIAIKTHELQRYIAGEFNEEVEKQPIEPSSLPQVPVPCDLPFHLIAYRPDIMAQKWLIESAYRQIQVAFTEYYPDFNLTALLGFQTINLQKLFEHKSLFFDIQPAFNLPIFKAGAIEANVSLNKVNYDLAILEYNDLILQATQQVLDGLALIKNIDAQLAPLYENKAFQEKVYELTASLLENNIGTILDKLNSESYVLQAQDLEIIALGNKIQAMLSLIKALGGGYDACPNR